MVAKSVKSVEGRFQVRGIMQRLTINHLVRKGSKLVLSVLKLGAAVKGVSWQCQKLVVNIGELLSDLIKSRFHDSQVNR